MQSTRGKTPQNPLSPSDLNQMLKNHLSRSFDSFWLSGEIIELYQSAAGHHYFTLKDDQSGIKCVLFRQKQVIKLKQGEQVTLLGEITLYTPKGNLQVNAIRVVKSGAGGLEQQLLMLKQKLSAAGLFDVNRKKTIPKVVRRLGIITSPNGAALHDILDVMVQNNPLIEITIYPTQVQGTAAPPMICDALRTADEDSHDVLLLTRGGGSKEDLWAFNDEMLAYQLAQLETPVISAVGHETDESISDLVADQSCITPTAAAHLLAGDFSRLKQTLIHHQQQLNHLIRDRNRQHQQSLDQKAHQLFQQHPERTLENQHQLLKQASKELHQTITGKTAVLQNLLTLKDQHLQSQLPDVHHQQQMIHNWIHRGTQVIKQKKHNANLLLTQNIRSLNNLNPLQVLARGYSLTTDEQQKPVTNSQQVKIGDTVETRLNSGKIRAKIFERLDKDTI